MRYESIVIAFLFVTSASRGQQIEPQRLSQLRESWSAAKERALKPINSRYEQELNKLLQLYTKSGNLDDAIAVRKEIERISSPSEAPPQKTPLKKVNEQKLLSGEWVKNASRAIEFNDGGSAKYTKSGGSNSILKWERKDEQIYFFELTPAKEVRHKWKISFKGDSELEMTKVDGDPDAKDHGSGVYTLSR